MIYVRNKLKFAFNTVTHRNKSVKDIESETKFYCYYNIKTHKKKTTKKKNAITKENEQTNWRNVIRLKSNIF